MNLERAYRTLLRLYPNDYRELFATEMLNTFEQAAAEHPRLAGLAFTRFLLGELFGLLCGAAAEWFAKLTGGSSVRRRVPGKLELAATGVSVSQACLPGEILEAQARIAVLIQSMVHAIAHHDFSGARRYSYEERQVRGELRRLQEKYHIDNSQE